MQFLKYNFPLICHSDYVWCSAYKGLVVRDARAIEFKRDHAISLGRIVLNSWVVFNELCTAKYVVGAAKNYG